MPKIQRIIKITKTKTDDWSEVNLRVDNQIFKLTDDEFLFLKELERNNEYIYELNEGYIINLDHSPRKIEEGIKNKKFIEDYKENINEKFFISYYVRRLNG